MNARGVHLKVTGSGDVASYGRPVVLSWPHQRVGAWYLELSEQTINLWTLCKITTSHERWSKYEQNRWAKSEMRLMVEHDRVLPINNGSTRRDLALMVSRLRCHTVCTTYRLMSQGCMMAAPSSLLSEATINQLHVSLSPYSKAFYQ